MEVLQTRRLDHLQADGCSSKRRENTASTGCSIICLTGSGKIWCLREKGKRKGVGGNCGERTWSGDIAMSDIHLVCIKQATTTSLLLLLCSHKMFFKTQSLNLAALEDAQLAPRAGHQTAVCMWNPSSTKLSFFRQGKIPSHGPCSSPRASGSRSPAQQRGWEMQG